MTSGKLIDDPQHWRERAEMMRSLAKERQPACRVGVAIADTDERRRRPHERHQEGFALSNLRTSVASGGRSRISEAG